MKDRKIENGILLKLLSVFLVIGICVICVGNTYSRYQETTRDDVTFVVRKATEYKITVDDWVQEESEQVTFHVGNKGQKQDSCFYVRFAATLGMNPEKVVLSVVVKNTYNGTERIYQGVASKIAEDSLLYTRIGEGYEYRFYDSDNRELIWELQGGKTSTQDFTLEITGAKEASLLELMIVETQEE